MENRPLISVIVPVYNMQNCLDICVDSILSQTYENLEIILVDDGSKDASPEICDSYAEKDSRIKVIHKENGGVSSARNAALAAASGEYIGFVDSDDSIRPNFFEMLYENLVKNCADVSVCKFSNCTEQAGLRTMAEQNEDDILSFTSEQSLINIFIGKHFVGHVWNKLFKADLLTSLRFDTSISVCEDTIFTVEALLNAKKICFTPAKLYNYFSRPSSALRNGFDEKLLTSHYACKKIISLVEAHGLGEKLKKYTDTLSILTDIIIIRRFGNDKEAIKKYAPMLQKSIKAHYNKESLPYMSSNTKRNMYLMMISWRLYFFILKIVRTH